MQEENLKTSLPEESKDNSKASSDSVTTKFDIWEILQYVGLGLCLVQLIITVVFAVLCFKSVLPIKLVLALFSALLSICAIFILLQRWRIPGIVTKVLSLAVSVLLIVGCVTLNTTNKGIGSITETELKHTDVISVFVKSDSGITELSADRQLIYGVMNNSYGTVEMAVATLEEKYSIKINFVTYSNAAELFKDLRDEVIDVAICDGDILGLLAEAEGFEGLSEAIKEITSTEVTVVVKDEVKPQGTPTPAIPVIPTNRPTEQPGISPTGDPAGNVTATPDVTGEPSVTGEPTEDITPTPTSYPLNYLGYDPYVPYTKYHTGNDHVYTILVNGVDQYEGFIGRGDVNIMVTVNTLTHQILMVTTPRDSYLPISCFDWQYDKLTHATALGGVKAAMQTLTNLYGVNCDYYFRVNFGGFVQLIDAIGGVTVYSDYDFDTEVGYIIHKGANELNGLQALAFARARHLVPGGEPSRGIHQMEVIRAIIEKCTKSTALLSNYAGVMAAAGNNMKTSVPESMIVALINNQIATLQGWDVVSYDIKHTDGGLYASYALNANAYMSIPDYNSVGVARDYFDQIYNDKIIVK